jgi:hypothetical protein
LTSPNIGNSVEVQEDFSYTTNEDVNWQHQLGTLASLSNIQVAHIWNSSLHCKVNPAEQTMYILIVLFIISKNLMSI